MNSHSLHAHKYNAFLASMVSISRFYFGPDDNRKNNTIFACYVGPDTPVPKSTLPCPISLSTAPFPSANLLL